MSDHFSARDIIPPIYLDGAATTRPHVLVVEEVARTMSDLYGNPSSPHELGVAAETSLEHARKRVARHLGVDPRGVYFNSGATEGNNTVIEGVARSFGHRGDGIVISGVEHPSVYEPARSLEREGFRITSVKPDSSGRLDPERVAQCIDSDTILVSVAAVSGETGIVQPLIEISSILRGLPEPRPIFHSDLAQAIGRLPLNIESLGLDCATISSHKIQGPRGTGILYVRPGLHISPLLRGGGQEMGLRSGTENLPGINGTALALDLLHEDRDKWRSMDFRQGLSGMLESLIPDTLVNGPAGGAGPDRAAPHILNVSFLGIPGEVLVHALEDRGIYASTGAACSSRDRRRTNYTLTNMGLADDRIESALRFSWSKEPPPEHAERLVEELQDLTSSLRRITTGH